MRDSDSVDAIDSVGEVIVWSAAIEWPEVHFCLLES